MSSAASGFAVAPVTGTLSPRARPAAMTRVAVGRAPGRNAPSSVPRRMAAAGGICPPRLPSLDASPPPARLVIGSSGPQGSTPSGLATQGSGRAKSETSAGDLLDTSRSGPVACPSIGGLPLDRRDRERLIYLSLRYTSLAL